MLATVLALTTEKPDFWLSFTQTFLADCLTMLVLAPALVVGCAYVRTLWLASGAPTREAPTGGAPFSDQALLTHVRKVLNIWLQTRPVSRVTEAFLLGLGLFAVGDLAFGGFFALPSTLPALLYAVLPLLLWAAVRFGLGGTSLALCGLTLVAIMNAIHGRGPFSSLTNTQDLLSLQVFFIAISAPLLVLAVLMHERQRAQEELEQSEARYRAVVSNFPDGAVLLFDAQLRHIFADGQGVRRDGIVAHTVVGATVWEAFPETVAARLAPQYQAALAGTSATFDLVADHRTYTVQTLPVHQNQVTAGMAVMQEVTEQRRAEALAALDQAKTAFFSNVSHEFRTPLTLMLGPIADALADRTEPLPPHQRERLELIQRSGQRLHKLVNTLLDFSRIEAGRIQAAYEPTDVATLTADLASMFRSAVERAGLQLRVECAPLTDLPQPVYVDRDMWEKIVLNLLSNALKFTFDGGITVTMHSTGERHDQVELEVSDTGTGIAEEETPHLFERFYSVQGARARTHEGAGIGLAMVQELARLHGGAVRVTSTPGVGSCFTVTIPTGNAHLPPERIVRQAQRGEVVTLAPSAPSAPSATLFVEEALRWLPENPTSPAIAPHPTAQPLDDPPRHADALPLSASVPREEATQPEAAGGRILLADDDADMRDYLTRLLSAHWEVQVVADGAAALAAAREQPPDLIMADVMMPDLDGFALLTALRDDPKTHALPIILLSARAGEEATVEGLQAGADDYLTKPFTAHELLARVQGRLELARMRREAAARAAQLDAVFEAITDGVLIHDLAGRGMYANRAYRDLLHRQLAMQSQSVDVERLIADPEEMARYITMSDEKGHLIPPAEWPTERALRGETLTGSSAIEASFGTVNGNALQISVTASPVCDADGQIFGAAAVFRDVTARRQLEQQVAEQANQLEAIFEAQADGVAVFDSHGRILRSNRALIQLFG
ncbi:MAG TPA: ATP-binding protein, partial [Ktedonobacterales bacterium]